MPITVHVLESQIQGEVTASNDPRLPVHTAVGLRLADPEGISEPSAAFQGVIHPILVQGHQFTTDGGQEVTFELLDRERQTT